MSGGSLNYFYSSMEEHIGDFGDKELDDPVKDLAQLFHDREWYLSSDTNEGSWRESRDAFKRKWFADGARKERVETYLASVRDEVMDSLGLSEKYCVRCKHWTKEHDKRYPDSPYGWCDLTRGCLMHRSEKCERFERRAEDA